MKTEKENIVQGKKSRAVQVLGVIVGLLVLCIVAMVAVGGWLVSSMTNNYSRKEYFEISINYGDKIRPESVSVDVESESESIVIRDPDTRLIEYIMFVDFKNAVEAVYRSKADDCILVPICEDFKSFEEEHALIYRQNGTLIAMPPRTYYDVKERVSRQEEIPQEMSNYCFTSNSYWAEKTEEDGRMKRGVQCCPCHTRRCICSRCMYA